MTPLHLLFLAAALVIAFAPANFVFAPASFMFAPANFVFAPVERTIRVEAADFAFAPEVVRVNPGDRVTIELVSKDVVHGLSIDGYPVNLTAEPGQTARVTFTASRPGSFKLRCSVACGNLHPFMTGKFEVGPNLLLLRGVGLGLLAFAFGAWRIFAGGAA